MSRKRPHMFLFSVVLSSMGALLMAASLFRLQQTVLKQQREQMLVIANSTARSIGNYMDGCMSALALTGYSAAFEQALESWHDGDSGPINECLKEFSSGRHPAISDAAILGADGEFLICSARHGDYTPQAGGEGIMPVYAGPGGKLYLGLTISVDTDNRLTVFVDIDRMYRNTAAFANLGEKGYVMIKRSDGLILMHPVLGQIGADVIKGRRERYPDLDYSELGRLIANQKAGKEGIEIYHSYWWADDAPVRVRKISAYTPVGIQNDFLIVSAVADYNELLRPIWIGSTAVCGAAILLTTGIISVVLYFRRAKESAERENLYLQEINRSLEEINSNQERMQHDQRLQLIGTLVSGIAHEFSNLLTPIMGYSGLLKESLPKEDPAREDIEEIYNSSVKAREIIEQITSLSRKNLEPAFHSLRLDEIISRILKVVATTKPENIEIISDIDFESYYIMGNTTQLNQIILNLCTNAFHAMRNGPGRLEVTGRIEQNENIRYAALIVSDNGEGILPELAPRIFDPFFTTKRTGEGTGLGLSIVQSIMELHNGDISVRSVPGCGTVFKLRFPTAPPGTAGLDADTQTLAASIINEVMIVEDDPAVRRLLARGLKKSGFTVWDYDSAETALYGLERRFCDLLVTDLNMAGMNGAELAIRVKSMNRNIKVLVLTGFPDKDILEYRRRGIIDGYLLKPVSIADLIRAIGEMYS